MFAAGISSQIEMMESRESSKSGWDNLPMEISISAMGVKMQMLQERYKVLLQYAEKKDVRDIGVIARLKQLECINADICNYGHMLALQLKEKMEGKNGKI
jgi:hypothetical protein